jgi:hypothetical protein
MRTPLARPVATATSALLNDLAHDEKNASRGLPAENEVGLILLYSPILPLPSNILLRFHCIKVSLYGDAGRNVFILP